MRIAQVDMYIYQLGVHMKRSNRIGLCICAGLIFLFTSPKLVKRLRHRDVPPSNIMTDIDIIKWIGQPGWVMRYSSPNEIYYEIGRDTSAILLIITGSSGSPSYTVDQTGRFIGWSPDSGEVAKPDQIHAENLIRERIDVDEFLRIVQSRKTGDISRQTDKALLKTP